MSEVTEREQARITVAAKGKIYEGWLQSEVSRSLENLAGTFSIPIALIPGSPPDIKRGDAVKVSIGSKQVIAGYVLSADPFYNAHEVGMRVIGRDRTGDLIQCSAVHRGGQWRKTRADAIIKDILRPFGLALAVDATAAKLVNSTVIDEFVLGLGETALDAIARAAKRVGVLVARDDAGRVLLTQAGAQRFRGAIVRGRNVISMDGVGSDENRHSDYIVYGEGGFSEDSMTRPLKATAKDRDVSRYLPLIINADSNTTQAELQRLADHTMRVRWGHSMGFRYTVEGWTFDGEPWPLNQRVPIYDDVAGLAGEEWLICAVRQTCTLKEGDVTELLVRPCEAYSLDALKSSVQRRSFGSRGPSDRALGVSK